MIKVFCDKCGKKCSGFYIKIETTARHGDNHHIHCYGMDGHSFELEKALCCDCYAKLEKFFGNKTDDDYDVQLSDGTVQLIRDGVRQARMRLPNDEIRR